MSLILVDHTKPRGAWAFDDEVAAVFDDMLRRSIPQYEEMRRLCFDIGSRFVQPDTCIVDLGCSRGEALAPFVRRFDRENRFCAVDASAPMVAACRARFAGEKINGLNIEIETMDLRYDYPAGNPSLVLAILTVQFVPIEYRHRLMARIYGSLVEGGAFVMVEKVLGHTAAIDDLLVSCYYDGKRRNGYSDEDIERKRLSLEGVLVPVTSDWNEGLLRSAGFTQFDRFWRYLNFSGWVAIK